MPDEMKVMQKCYTMLMGLTPAERARALNWLNERIRSEANQPAATPPEAIDAAAPLA